MNNGGLGRHQPRYMRLLFMILKQEMILPLNIIFCSQMVISGLAHLRHIRLGANGNNKNFANLNLRQIKLGKVFVLRHPFLAFLPLGFFAVGLGPRHLARTHAGPRPLCQSESMTRDPSGTRRAVSDMAGSDPG